MKERAQRSDFDSICLDLVSSFVMHPRRTHQARRVAGRKKARRIGRCTNPK
jgi:hypothetical protein